MKFSKDIKRYADYSGKSAITLRLPQQGLWALLQYCFYNWDYNPKSPKIIKLPLLFVGVCHQKGMEMITGITLLYAAQIGEYLLHAKAVISKTHICPN
jgi:serine O-acetyltransferase